MNKGKLQICIVGPGAGSEESKAAIMEFITAHTDLDIEIVAEPRQDIPSVYVGEDRFAETKLEHVIKSFEICDMKHLEDERYLKEMKKQDQPWRDRGRSKRDRRLHR